MEVHDAYDKRLTVTINFDAAADQADDRLGRSRLSVESTSEYREIGWSSKQRAYV